MKISEILWKAANECLQSTADEDTFRGKGSVYCCLAIHYVRGGSTPSERAAAVRFVNSLGMPCSGNVFGSFRSKSTRQNVRYAWLMFASMYAAELEAKGEL